MRTQRFLLVVICCFISSYSYATSESKLRNIGLSNNYLTLFFAEYMPHSAGLKKQTLTIENVQPTSFTSDITISANDNGYILQESVNEQTDLLMDYQTQLLGRNEQGTLVQYTVQFDDKKEIISVKDANQNTIATYQYDHQGRLVSSDEMLSNKQFIGSYAYDVNNNLIEYKQQQIEMLTSAKTLTFPTVNEYSYDENNRLISTKSNQQNPMLNGQAISLSDEIDKSKYRTSTCYFSQYNEYGDWLMSQCFNHDNELNKTITRQLEYK